jgi:hypothetical protein
VRGQDHDGEQDRRDQYRGVEAEHSPDQGYVPVGSSLSLPLARLHGHRLRVGEGESRGLGSIDVHGRRAERCRPRIAAVSRARNGGFHPFTVAPWPATIRRTPIGSARPGYWRSAPSSSVPPKGRSGPKADRAGPLLHFESLYCVVLPNPEIDSRPPRIRGAPRPYASTRRPPPRKCC